MIVLDPDKDLICKLCRYKFTIGDQLISHFTDKHLEVLCALKDFQDMSKFVESHFTEYVKT